MINMPAIIYGTAWKKERTADLVIKAVECGFRGIDTACQPKHYNEAGVGEAIAKLKLMGVARDSLFIQTKFTPVPGHDTQKMPYDLDAPLAEQVAQSFSMSQKNLGTDYVDSLVLHSPYPQLPDLMKVWRAMEALYKDGKAKQLGISNCYDLYILQRLVEESTVKPKIVQNRFFLETEYDRDLRTWCQLHGIGYQSFWTLTANPHILKSAFIQELTQKYQKTEAQVFFRYLTQIGITPLTGTTSEQHMKEDLAIFDFTLNDAEKLQIATLLDQAAG
jgi:diketogulonate reductase-like aldo/keto reductase